MFELPLGHFKDLNLPQDVQGDGKLAEINALIDSIKNKCETMTAAMGGFDALRASLLPILAEVEKVVNVNAVGSGLELCAKKNRNYQLNAARILKALREMEENIQAICGGDVNTKHLSSLERACNELIDAVEYHPTEVYIKRKYKREMMLLSVLGIFAIIASFAIVLTCVGLLTVMGVTAIVPAFVAAAAVAYVFINGADTAQKEYLNLASFKTKVNSMVIKIKSMDVFSRNTKQTGLFFTEESPLRSAIETMSQPLRVTEAQQAVEDAYREDSEGISPAYRVVDQNRQDKLEYIRQEIMKAGQELKQVNARIDDRARRKIAVKRAIERLQKVVESKNKFSGTNYPDFTETTSLMTLYQMRKKMDFDFRDIDILIYNKPGSADDDSKEQNKKAIVELNLRLLIQEGEKLENKEVYVKGKMVKYKNEGRQLKATDDNKRSHWFDECRKSKVVEKLPTRFEARKNNNRYTFLLFSASSRKIADQLKPIHDKLFPKGYHANY